MPRAVGLDIGSRMLKLVELTGSARAFKVQRVEVRPVPEGTGEEADQALADLVRGLFREARLPKDDVCVSFDAGSTIFREITVPFQTDDQIEKVVRFEAENHLHGRAIEDVVVNWVKTAETKEGSQLIILASPKIELARRLGVLKRAGIEPASVDLDATALFTACEAAGVFEQHPSVVLVDIGARTTNLLLVDGARLKLVRCFLVGCESISTALQGDLSLPPEEAAKKALLPTGPDPDALLVPAVEALPAGRETAKGVAELEKDVAAQRRDEFAKKLQRELARSFASARTQSAPDCILVAGGGSLLPGLTDALAARFEMKVEPLDLLSRVGAKLGTLQDARFQSAVAPTAVGCALRLLGADPLGVELRQDEFAPSNKFDVVKGALAVAVTLLFVLLLALTVIVKEKRDHERDVFRQVSKRVRGMYVEAEEKYLAYIKGFDEKQAKDLAAKSYEGLPDDASRLRAVVGKMQARHRELENTLGLSKDVPEIPSALKVWREVYAALGTIPRQDLGWFRVNRMNVTPQSVQVTFEYEEKPNTLQLLREAFEKNEYLLGRAKDKRNMVHMGGQQKNQEGRYTVPFDIPFDESTQ